jgi:ribonuclease P protein component
VLRKRAEFLAVAASGKKWVAPGFILQIGPPRPATPSIHYGLTASRKVGNAVIRNRCRRRLRALAVELLPHATPEHDYVLIARPTTAEHDFADMRRDMIKGMQRMKVWRDCPPEKQLQ